MLPNGNYIFDSKGAMSALNSIGKYLGMFTEKVKIDANIETNGKLGAILDVLHEAEHEDGTVT